MKIQGVEGLSVEQVQNEIARGGRFVQFGYCVSALVVTFRRSTDIHFLRPGESGVVKGLPWTFLSLVVGWWGFPWGLIYTPAVLIQNLSGGKDVTPQMMAYLAQNAAPSASGPPPGTWPPPPTAFPSS